MWLLLDWRGGRDARTTGDLCSCGGVTTLALAQPRLWRVLQEDSLKCSAWCLAGRAEGPGVDGASVCHWLVLESGVLWPVRCFCDKQAIWQYEPKRPSEETSRGATEDYLSS